MLDQPYPPQQPAPSNRATIRALMCVVAFGFFIVLTALLLMLWPGGVSADTKASPTIHVLKVIQQTPDEPTLNLPRHLLDFAVYALVLAGLWFMVRAVRDNARGALIGLMVVGALGLAYAGTSGLYVGPMFSICGFSLILFGGMLAWAATSPPDPTETGTDVETGTETGERAERLTPDTLDKRTNDNASHSIA